jgi:hypothetical protein
MFVPQPASELVIDILVDQPEVANAARLLANTLKVPWHKTPLRRHRETLVPASVSPKMPTQLARYSSRSGTTLNRVALFLDSAGGQVEEGDRVIEALNEIKLRHQLITVVPHGKLCASMRIPIFLQGEDRLAARASLWIFHEAAQRQANGERRIDKAETWRLFRKYYVPAGVSVSWLKSIAPMIKEADQREARHHHASAGGPDRAGRSASAGRRGPWP